MPRVFFDGACPLCAREIEFYQKQEGASGIAWVDGAAAFAYLWSALPRFQLAGKLARTAPALWALEHLYNLFLPLRPYLQRWVTRRHGANCGAP